jgi:DNA-binding HxlR family transcriptional regulator
MIAMKAYGQYCPVAKGAEIFAERWMPLVLRELLRGSTRFNDLHRGVPLMSRTLLACRLRQLEEVGAIERKSAMHGWEYHLTAAGQAFAPVVQQLGEWGQRWFRSRFESTELDVGVLVWDMHFSVKPGAFPGARCAVQFDFSGVSDARRAWWLVCEGDVVDICPTDPGFGIDLYVATDLQTMTRVWMGEMPVALAIRTGLIELEGRPEFRKCFERWLGLSAYANIADSRDHA